MSHDQTLGEFENTMKDALATCLKRIMAQGGKPHRPKYRHDLELYEVHSRQWDDAEKVLKAYEAQTR